MAFQPAAVFGYLAAFVIYLGLAFLGAEAPRIADSHARNGLINVSTLIYLTQISARQS